MTRAVRLTNICPVFLSSDVRKTAAFYADKLGFKYAHHFDKAESFATVYRDDVEIVIVQALKGAIESNTARHGAGYDAYIDANSLEAIRALHEELRAKGVDILSAPHITDYGSLEFVIRDIDGRLIGFGLISDKEKFFERSNYLVRPVRDAGDN